MSNGNHELFNVIPEPFLINGPRLDIGSWEGGGGVGEDAVCLQSQVLIKCKILIAMHCTPLPILV